MSSDPIRMLDDDRLSGPLRDDLRAVGPGADYDVEAGLARFTALVAGGAVVGGAGAAAKAASAATAAKGAAAGAGTVLAVKVTGVLVLCLIGAGLFLHARNEGTQGSAGMMPPVSPTVVNAAPIAGGRTVARNDDLPVAPTGTEAKGTPIPPSPSSPAQRARVPGEANPAGVPHASSSDAPLVTEEGHGVKDEADQLAALREVSISSPARALAMAEEGHKRFPKGVFWQEREVRAILSLVSLGRRDEARARATALLARHPETPYAEVVRLQTGLDPVPPAPSSAD